MPLPLTPTQTVGPYFAIGLSWLNGGPLRGPGSDGSDTGLAGPALEGERVAFTGRVLDGDGRPVDDAVLEIWQADARGRYAAPRGPDDPPPAFTGFGRIATAKDGSFGFTTVKPGPVPGPGGAPQAPHLAVTVMMRGLLRHLCTRVYFPDESTANAADPVLGAVPAERRPTLVARPLPGAGGVRLLGWDVRLQGPDETVFFDL
jgi:protocatechuate 3,4-dioxygenase alpha subunit